MAERDEVMRWWLERNLNPDPRGPSPGFFYYYDYNLDRWKTLVDFLEI
jgi:hypothetical protein